MMKKCPVSEKCGACSCLKVPYSQQLKAKREDIRRLFPGVNVSEVIGMDQPYHYRHKIYFAFGYDHQGRVNCGLFQENSHRII